MPRCPYCFFETVTRRQHVLHLSTSHASSHAHNIATSRVGTSRNDPQRRGVVRSTIARPIQQHTFTPPFQRVSSRLWSVHCDVCISHQSSWVPVAERMELRHTCSSCVDSQFSFPPSDCQHSGLTSADLRLYCPGGLCLYPPLSSCWDDRICDWSRRSRTLDRCCLGHVPYLRPTSAAWGETHFSQVTFPRTYERVTSHASHCSGFSSSYSPPSPSWDDRIPDWGGRDRTLLSDHSRSPSPHSPMLSASTGPLSVPTGRPLDALVDALRAPDDDYESLFPDDPTLPISP